LEYPFLYFVNKNYSPGIDSIKRFGKNVVILFQYASNVSEKSDQAVKNGIHPILVSCPVALTVFIFNSGLLDGNARIKKPTTPTLAK
jgi:hypothetical protein